MKKIYEVLEGVYSNDSLRRTIVPLFVGNPGIARLLLLNNLPKTKELSMWS